MPILIQGMRRSGTTILYDALLEDPGLHCFYEPFREDTETPGGGSDARDTDPFTETRELRKRYRDDRFPDLELNDFNWGGPGEPAREIGPGLPEHCVGFLRMLLARPGNVMVKETRFYDKLETIAPLAGDSGVLVHVVRDPRAVAASMMMGRAGKRQEDYPDADSFFAEDRKRKLWSSRQLSQQLLKRPDYTGIRKPANHLRILMVWKHTFESTYRDGHRLFGDRYLLLRNEELRADPAAAIGRVYAAVGRPTPAVVAEWAQDKVRAPEAPFAAHDPRWFDAFARLDLKQALADAGYPELAAATPEVNGGGMLGRARARLGR